jgi:hypothetical protein
MTTRPPAAPRVTNQSALLTTLGPLRRDQLGMILPHEHVFVDLRTPDTPGYAEAEAADVVALMAPEIERIKALGITALVECTTGGVGRRADLDLAVSLATQFPIVVPTGNYRSLDPRLGPDAEAALERWMLRERGRFDGRLQGRVDQKLSPATAASRRSGADLRATRATLPPAR